MNSVFFLSILALFTGLKLECIINSRFLCVAETRTGTDEIVNIKNTLPVLKPITEVLSNYDLYYVESSEAYLENLLSADSEIYQPTV